ncbi:MAG: hypothetical protein J5509_09220 [Lachnospiraceae bacterium]|nr:hypothetical protein [Lachnospiraceae bacterium]
MNKKIITVITIAILCFTLVSCQSTDNVSGKGGESTESYSANQDTFDWEDDPTIGKVQPGSYKRVGIAKKDETYEELLELRESANKGYLVVGDDGTAVFELDGEKTEYLYDEFSFYLSEDTEKTNGIPYVYIDGRLITNDGTTITQYLFLSEDGF